MNATDRIRIHRLTSDDAGRFADLNTLEHLAAERGAWVVFVQADHGDDPEIAVGD